MPIQSIRRREQKFGLAFKPFQSGILDPTDIFSNGMMRLACSMEIEHRYPVSKRPVQFQGWKRNVFEGKVGHFSATPQKICEKEQRESGEVFFLLFTLKKAGKLILAPSG